MIKDKPLKEFTYWVCPAKRKGVPDIREKTRKAANAERHKSYHYEPQKVTVTYRDTLELIRKCSGVYSNDWEK